MEYMKGFVINYLEGMSVTGNRGNRGSIGTDFEAANCTVFFCLWIDRKTTFKVPFYNFFPMFCWVRKTPP